MGTLTPSRLDPAITATLREAADGVRARAGARIGDMVEEALLRTLTDTVTLGDDGTYGYNIPANLFAAQALRAIGDIATEVLGDPVLADDAWALSRELVAGVEKFGVVDAPSGAGALGGGSASGGRVYAYEVDGLGGVLCMDDANTPSLLSLPLVAPDVVDDGVWRATRELVLSPANPYYFAGTAASGVGSPHTEPGRVWPIALAVEALTGTPEDRVRTLDLLARTDGGTGRMHESFDASDPTAFSRPWFSWADSMFCELALVVADEATSAPA